METTQMIQQGGKTARRVAPGWFPILVGHLRDHVLGSWHVIHEDMTDPHEWRGLHASVDGYVDTIRIRLEADRGTVLVTCPPGPSGPSGEPALRVQVPLADRIGLRLGGRTAVVEVILAHLDSRSRLLRAS